MSALLHNKLTTLTDLPVEIHRHIARYLDQTAIFELTGVCTRLKTIIECRMPFTPGVTSKVGMR